MKIEDIKERMSTVDKIINNRPWDDYSQDLQNEYDELLKQLNKKLKESK